MRSEEWWCKRFGCASAFGRLLWAASPRYGGAFEVCRAERGRKAALRLPKKRTAPKRYNGSRKKEPALTMSFRATAQRFARNLF